MRFMLRNLLVLLALSAAPLFIPSLSAQNNDRSVGLSATAEHKLAKGLKAQAEMEVRTQNGLGNLERWALDLGLDYKLSSYIKAHAGYALMDRYHLQEITSKGNIISGYWAPRHRWYAGVVLADEWGRWKISLRERYQLTHSPLQYVPKYQPDGKRMTDEVEAGDQDHILRSRLQATYNIRHSKLTPSLSIEMLNDLTTGDIDQMRYAIGLDYSLSKRKSLSLQWRYKDRADSDEANGHLIILGYNFSF